MSDVEFDNSVIEVIDGVVVEVHSIEDVDSASDVELKHTPNIELVEQASGQLAKVTIGLKGIAHPQTEEHHISMIRAFVGTDPVGTFNFGPDDVPAAEFEVKRSSEQLIVQALCNLHGLWEARL
jgi:desulfoferrodoxin-like iron-binding protein